MYIGQKCPFVLSCHARKLFFFYFHSFSDKKSQKLYDANQINNVQCVCVRVHCKMRSSCNQSIASQTDCEFSTDSEYYISIPSLLTLNAMLFRRFDSIPTIFHDWQLACKQNTESYCWVSCLTLTRRLEGCQPFRCTLKMIRWLDFEEMVTTKSTKWRNPMETLHEHQHNPTLHNAKTISVAF